MHTEAGKLKKAVFYFLHFIMHCIVSSMKMKTCIFYRIFHVFMYISVNLKTNQGYRNAF